MRLESKISLDVDWRLAQVPLVQKTTTDFEPLSVDHEFGLGDANFQVIVAHAIDERWAFGVEARVSAQTGADSLGSGEWQVMPVLGVLYAVRIGAG